jgi:NADPH:quinone reductase-like Zn-dependent oxidoreductase
LDDDVSFEAGASAIVNPVTVLTMLEEAKEKGAKSVVHTAAASALGRMFVKYF